MRYAILRIQKLKSGAAVRRSLLHSFREQHTPNADPDRTHENSHFGATSTSEALDRFNKRLATQSKVRSNAVLIIEYLVTGSPEAMTGKTREEQDAYFSDTLEWLKRRHGEENVVYAGVHRDETTPHLYCYVVPLDERGKLNCRAFLGGAAALRTMQTAFAEQVAARHGLERGMEGSRARHQSVRRFYSRLEAMADDPRLQPMQMRKLPPIPPEPGLLDRLNGTAEPMKAARAQAMTKRKLVEEHNRQAAEHNRRRGELLEQLASRGLASQIDRQEREQLIVQAKEEAARAEGSQRALQAAMHVAKQRTEYIETLKAERDGALQRASWLESELISASPNRARDVGLLSPEPQRSERRQQPEADDSPQLSGP